MNTRTMAVALLSLIALAGSLHAQQDHLIENQRNVLIIDNTTWGDTYVGQYTSGNSLFLVDDPSVINTNNLTLTSGNAFVGYAGSASNNIAEVSLSNATWQVSSLNIGATNNSGNIVYIADYGTVEVANGVSIYGAANTNGLMLMDSGTLYIKSDFDASMDGFVYSNATLKIGGELRGMDNVSNGMSVVITGEENGTNATWNVESGTLTLGLIDDDNSILLEEGALLATSNLWIGDLSSTGNTFVVDSDARAHIQNEILILGSGNALQVTNGGWLEVEMDFDATMAGFELQTGGGLEVHRGLTLDAITNGVLVVLDGPNAVWDRTGLPMDIGSTTNSGGNTLTVRNGANAFANQLNLGGFSSENLLTITNSGSVQVDSIQIGETNTQDNAVLIADGGNLILDGIGSYINASNSLTLVQGGRLTVKADFASAIDWDDDAFFYWANGGILEVQGAAPIFSEYTVSGQYTEYGTLFLRDGQILILNGSNAVWNAAPHNLHVGDLSSGNALIVTNGANAEVKSMTIGDFKESGHDNLVLITGADSEIHSLGDVEVGGRFLDGEWIDGGSNNTLRIEDGGALISDGAFRFGGNNNIFSIDGAASQFSVAGDILFGGSQQFIRISGGAALTNNALSMTGDGNTLLVDGGGSVLATTVDMTIDGSDLLIGVTDGGTLTGGGAFTISGAGSSVFIDGANSLFSASGDIVLNGSDIILRVSDGGMLSSGAALRNQNGSGTSGLQIGLGSTISASSYYQVDGAFLNYEINQSPTNLGILQITDTAEFEAGAKLGFYGISNLALDVTYSNMLVSSETLIIGGNTNATSDDLELLDTSESALVKFLLMVQNDDIWVILNRISLGESAGFSEGSMMWDIAEEIDRLSLSENENAANQIEILSGMSSDQQNRQLNQFYAYQLPTYMHNQSVFGGIDQVRARGLSAHEPSRQETRSKPKGAAGPHTADQGLQGWAKVYGNFGSRDKDDASGFVDGYDAQTYGTVIGFDQAFGDWLFGLAGGYAGSTLDGDNGDESEGKTGYGILYANYGTTDWFGDMLLAYGLTDVDNTSGTDFGVTSSTDASQSAFYIGGGYQFEDKPTGSLFRPSLGLQTGLYDQDAYTESGNVLVKDVDGFDRWSAVSSLGASVIYPKRGNKVDTELLLRAFWLHEFNDDDEQVGYTLVGSGLRGQFVMRSPDRDAAQFGLGYVAKGKNGWQLRGDIDLQLSETFTSTTLSGALLYEF